MEAYKQHAIALVTRARELRGAKPSRPCPCDPCLGGLPPWAETLSPSNQQTTELRLDATLQALYDAVAPAIREMNSYLLAHIKRRRARSPTISRASW